MLKKFSNSRKTSKMPLRYCLEISFTNVKTGDFLPKNEFTT